MVLRTKKETSMETLKTRSVVGEDRRLRIELEVALPPGPVEVVLVVSQDAVAQPRVTDQETARQRFLAAAGCGESGDPLASRRVDEVLYGKQP
jgi:hypothetical protein